jgi:hypothetical protein
VPWLDPPGVLDWVGCGGGLADLRRQKGDRLISHELDPRSVSAPVEIVSKSQCR